MVSPRSAALVAAGTPSCSRPAGDGVTERVQLDPRQTSFVEQPDERAAVQIAVVRATGDVLELLLVRLVAWHGRIIEGEAAGVDQDEQDDNDQDDNTRQLLAE